MTDATAPAAPPAAPTPAKPGLIAAAATWTVESVTALITATGSFLGSPAMMALIAFGTGVGTMAVKHHYEAKPAIIGAVLPKEQRPATLSDVATIAADSSALIVKQLSAKIDALSAPVPMPATRLAPSKTRLIK